MTVQFWHIIVRLFEFILISYAEDEAQEQAEKLVAQFQKENPGLEE